MNHPGTSMLKRRLSLLAIGLGVIAVTGVYWCLAARPDLQEGVGVSGIPPSRVVEEPKRQGGESTPDRDIDHRIPAIPVDECDGRVRLTLRPYDGEYASLPYFWNRVAKFQEALRWAIPDVREYLRVPGSPGVDVVVLLVDYDPSGFRFGASTGPATWDADSTIEIRIRTDRLYSDSMDLVKVARHEAVHLWKYRVLGRNAMKMPHWLSEGTAVAIAGEAEEVVGSFCSRRLQWVAIGSMLEDWWGELFEEDGDYALAYLTVQWVLSRSRSVPPDEYLRQLAVAEDWEQLLLQNSDVDLSQSRVPWKSWISEEIERASTGRIEYLRAKRCFIERDYAGARVQYQVFLGSCGKSPFRARAFHELATSCYELGRYEEACLWLDTGLREFPFSKMRAVSEALLVRAHHAAGNRSLAMAMREDVLRDFKYLSLRTRETLLALE